MPAPKWLFLSFYSMWCFRWALLLYYDYFSHVTQLFARIKRQTRNADSHSGHFVAPWSDVSLVSDVGSVEGLAYHKGWDTLYWTSSTTSTITRQTVDQSQAGAISRQAVVTLSEEDHPHVLALDECQRSVVVLIMHFSPFITMLMDPLLTCGTLAQNIICLAFEVLQVWSPQRWLFSRTVLLLSCHARHSSHIITLPVLFHGSRAYITT